MKNSIIMIYGPHDNEYFQNLSTILKKQIELLRKKASAIESVIEYNGPYFKQFLVYIQKFKEEKLEVLFDLMKKY